MSIWRRAQAVLPPGVYDEIVSEALATRLTAVEQTHAVELEAVGKDSDVDEQLVTLIRDAARVAIESRGDAREKVAVARELLGLLARDGSLRADEAILCEQLLRGIAVRVPGGGATTGPPPRGSLLSSGLITNAHGESVLSHLSSEFASADRIDLLCSFIKLSGLDKFRPVIERHRALGRPLRVLTTTYMRATEVAAVALLHRLGAEVRISYDDATTRLHAKSWLFHRDSEYSTAYVGSSNLSHAAQTEGLEWNVRIAQADQPELFDEMRAVFETYWVDADRFEPFDGTDAASRRLVRALTEPDRSTFVGFDLEPKDWQKPILRELEGARTTGRTKNLVVAATGTGKTLIAAFDYENLLRAGQVDSLLFIAHRKEILEQSRRVFREVLRRQTFGELWVDGQQPSDGRHVFASVQSLAQATDLRPDAFDHVVVDEVHHAAAESYVQLLYRLRPKQLVGLTATPERADGRVYEQHFPRPYIGNLRVWDAIQQQILVPFRYFVLDVEGLDLSDARWNGGYVESELSDRLIRAQDLWVHALARGLKERIARPDELRALAFCADQAHARVVADRLGALGLPARALTHETPRDERDRAKGDLTSGKVRVLCVVDLFNEGVDIPDVNALFLFRPTESTTVFLQQLGRGLRRSRNKDILTVLDVTGRQHPSFRFDRHLRELLGHTPRELREFLERGFGRLPSGCVLHFEERAQKDILDRVRRGIPTSLDGLRALLAAHRDAGWDLATFLAETEVDPLDLYRRGRSWTSLRAEVDLATVTGDEVERDALANVHKLLHVSDSLRLDAWRRFVALEPPRSELERRIAAMLFVVLYGPFAAARLGELFDRWRSHATLREELRQLIPVIAARADALPRAALLQPDVPVVVHGRYLDLELSAAFAAATRGEGKYRHFYTGVEPVADGRFDLLLVTLDKGDQKHERLRYDDFPLTETRFQWQSQSRTRADSEDGLRHLEPAEHRVQPLLFVREAKKDARGVTDAFRFLGPVLPRAHRGERPITIEWELSTPLLPEWVRRWRNVS